MVVGDWRASVYGQRWGVFMIGLKSVCEGGCERGCEEKCEGQGIIGGDYESDKKCEGTNQP